MIRTERIGVRLGKRHVLEDISLTLSPGELVGVAGPNGAGKSTLIRALCALVPVSAGRVLIGARDAATLRPAEIARTVAWLGQSRQVAWDMCVEDIAALGRHGLSAVPYARSAPVHKTAIDAALDKAGASHLCGRSFNALSGGEQARVHIARVLASPAPVLLLDEPCAALDVAHQLGLMATLRSEAAAGRAVMVVLHDLSLLLQACPRTVVLDKGRLVADSASADVLDAARLAAIFGIRREPGGRLERV